MFRAVFRSVLRQPNRLLYQWCKRLVDRHQGDNNADMQTNGELRILQNNMPQFKCVFDVGANIGEWTRLALHLNPALVVHCFEPSHSTFQRLLANPFSANVHCHNIACGAASGSDHLYIFSEGAGINSLYRRTGLDTYGLKTPDKTEAIQLIALDDYCDSCRISFIDYLKVDVEGHELEVLKGTRRMFESGRIGAVQFEYGGTFIDANIFLRDMFTFFRHLPYSLHKIFPDFLQHYPSYDQRLENMQYQNWVAIRHDFPFQK